MITLTREEAQQVLDALQCATPPTFSTKIVEDWQSAVEFLRARLAQPEREWQGLTDEEINNILEEIMSLLPGAVRLPPGWTDTVRAIEAKLKEKNTWAK
jgi:hypothetical protein